jgi:hypothetical protein
MAQQPKTVRLNGRTVVVVPRVQRLRLPPEAFEPKNVKVRITTNIDLDVPTAPEAARRSAAHSVSDADQFGTARTERRRAAHRHKTSLC